MSERNHTPLPLKMVAAGAGVRASVSQLYKLETPLVGKTLGELLEEQEANAVLLQQSVNAGQLVEELVEAAKDAQAVIALFAHGRGLDSREASTQKRLEEAIREVSAALGGKAE